MRAKLHHLRHAREADHEGHIDVSGLLDVDGHKLPFKHKIHVSAHPKELEARLDEHHDKAKLWLQLRPAVNAWTGASEAIGETALYVRFAEIAPYGPHQWTLRVLWDETVGAVSNRKKREWSAASPAELPKIEKVKEIIRNDVATRALHHQAADTQLRALRALRDETERGRGL